MFLTSRVDNDDLGITAINFPLSLSVFSWFYSSVIVTFSHIHHAIIAPEKLKYFLIAAMWLWLDHILMIKTKSWRWNIVLQRKSIKLKCLTMFMHKFGNFNTSFFISKYCIFIVQLNPKRICMVVIGTMRIIMRR